MAVVVAFAAPAQPVEYDVEAVNACYSTALLLEGFSLHQGIDGNQYIEVIDGFNASTAKGAHKIGRALHRAKTVRKEVRALRKARRWCRRIDAYPPE